MQSHEKPPIARWRRTSAALRCDPRLMQPERPAATPLPEQSSQGSSTPMELFLEGVRVWKPGIRKLLASETVKALSGRILVSETASEDRRQVEGTDARRAGARIGPTGGQ